MKGTIGTDQLAALVLAASHRILKDVDLLTQADRDIGDGDHGFGMSRGFTAVLAKLKTNDLNEMSPGQLLKTVGDTLIDTMGGASGVVFGTMFFGGAKALGGLETLSLDDLGRAFEGSCEQITRRAKAEPGDKTMLDALVPAAAAIRSIAASGGSWGDGLSAAAKAAAEGRDATKKMVARFGKASTMGDRSIGFPDAGAVSVAIMFDSMAQTAETFREEV